MNSRARMSNLASMLLQPEDRAEAAPVETVLENQEASNRKTRKQVLGKVVSRQISVKRGKKTAAPADINIHRAYGDRGDFEKVTVTLPSDVRGMLLDESVKRKRARSADWAIAAIVREAIAAYLSPKQ